MAEKFKNLFVKDTSDTLLYTSKKSIVGKLRIPARDRIQHSTKLQNQFTQAWKDACTISNTRKAVSLPTKEGIYLEFKSSPEHDLITKRLEDHKKGIKLLNVKKEKIEDIEFNCATVFIPSSKESHFIKKFQEYGEKNTRKGNPKHDELVRSIEDIKLAILESFWQDKKEWMPGDSPLWCEIWLRTNEIETESETETEKSFKKIANLLNIKLQKDILKFPERMVFLGLATNKQLKELIESCEYIAEFRKASETPYFFMNIENREQVEWINNLLDRITVDKNSKVAICILDTGVNNGHPLLQNILEDVDCQACKKDWGYNDHHKHGTLMAGLAAYGDLQNLLENSQKVNILQKLESIKILPPTNNNDPNLYGCITRQCVSRAEINKPERKRIICMAITTNKCEEGRPSSWSAAIDSITSGYFDNQKRLFIISAGNVNSGWENYPESNILYPIEDPGQSWNAITVGACTKKILLSDENLKDYKPIAQSENLSPFSPTSILWEKKWPIKPDIILEGGNIAKDNTNLCLDCDDLSLLSTYYKPTDRHFGIICGTSASTAQAAWMAAQIQANYPDAWPETIRALLIHSAEWTDSMKNLFLKNPTKKLKTEYQHLLKICGYGIPKIDKALWCAKNSVNLVIQEELRPYEKKDNRGRTRDMNIHELPWPNDTLLNLGETNVIMRITLSYFIEPSPGERGWKDRYRYPSYLLRFDVNKSTETRETFIRRINAAAEDHEENEDSTTSSTSSSNSSNRWLIGTQGRDLGSIHSDIWEGTAAELAVCNLIGIYPKTGWWKERLNLQKYNNKIRYSLIVSITTPLENVDIYTPIINKIKVSIPVAIKHKAKPI
ncbi:MAG: S8 family peptidase [Candidatus Eremiobacterota bacterium]